MNLALIYLVILFYFINSLYIRVILQVVQTAVPQPKTLLKSIIQM